MTEIITTMSDLTTIMASTGTTGTTLITGDGITTGGTTIIAIGIMAIGGIMYLLDQKFFLNQNQQHQE